MSRHAIVVFSAVALLSSLSFHPAAHADEPWPTGHRSRLARAGTAITTAGKEEARWRREAGMPTRSRGREQTGPRIAARQRDDLAPPIEGEAHGPAMWTQGPTAELTLDQSVEIALQHNLTVQIVTLTRDAVAEGIPQAKAIFHPTIGTSVTAAGDREVPEGAPVSNTKTQTATAFIAEALPTGASLVVSSDFAREDADETTPPQDYSSLVRVSVVQPLLRGGGFVVATRPIRDAEFDLRVEEARLRAECLRVTAATKTAYYNVLLAEKVIEAIEDALQRDRTLTEASRALLRGGLVTKRDVFSAEFLLADDSAKLVAAQADLELAKNDLLEVLGIPIGTELDLLDKDIDAEPIPLELNRWVETALENRPETLELEERLRKSLLNIRVASNTVLPQVDLVASYAKTQDGSSVSRALDLNGEIWTAGLVFSIPIGNVAARSARDQAKIEHTRIERELEQTRRLIELEVRAAVIKLRRSLDSLKALTAAMEQIRGKLEVAESRFSLGLATNLDVTDAQEDLLDTETNLLTALVEYHVGLAELEASIASTL